MATNIDIIIPVYNDAKSLLRCLRSVSEQTMSKDLFQVIIVDDGSNDTPGSVITHFSDLNIKFIEHSENLGLPAAINTALKNAQSRYFVRLDSDDYVHSGFLDAMYWVFENNPSTTAVAVDYKKVDQHENILSYHSSKQDPIGCGIMFRRIIVDQIGYYNESFRLAEEVEFLLRFKKNFSLTHLNICLYRYTQKNGTLTTDKARYNEYINKANSLHKMDNDE